MRELENLEIWKLANGVNANNTRNANNTNKGNGRVGQVRGEVEEVGRKRRFSEGEGGGFLMEKGCKMGGVRI